MAKPNFPDVTYHAKRAGSAFRGEVIDIHTQQRLDRTVTTYASADTARSAAAAQWRARQAKFLRFLDRSLPWVTA